MSQWRELEQKYYLQTVRRQPVVIVRGQGTHVWDENGKEYLDFTAGWAVNNLGHCPAVIIDAIETQARTLIQTSNQFYTTPQLNLVQMLVENSCLDRVFVCNSGAEAVEGTIKLARKYGRLHRNGAHEIITAFNSFHGRTLTTLAATGQPHYQEPFQPLIPGFVHVPYDNLEALRIATTDKTCAVLLEPVQGEGGVNVPAPDYFLGVRQWCDENNLLLILDEVQTGLGRLGSLWGYERFNIEPDVMAIAKALGGGVPIGAFLVKEKHAVLDFGDHGSTFGGNALTCAAAVANFGYILGQDIPKQAQRMGELLASGLADLQKKHQDLISGVRGMGLLLGLEFKEDVAGTALENCNKAGILLNQVRPNILRFMPPLTISPEEIREGLVRVDHALTAMYR